MNTAELSCLKSCNQLENQVELDRSAAENNDEPLV